jgi:AraC-like DNA-binding protein
MSSRLDRVSDWETKARTAHYRSRELAILCKCSERQLERYFQKIRGMPPGRWLMTVRLEDAKTELKQGGLVKEIASQLGFKQVSHFCRVFKDHFGMPPTRYALNSWQAGDKDAKR